MADNAVNEPTFLGYSQGKTVASGASSIIGAVANTIQSGVDAIDTAIKTQAGEDTRTKIQNLQDQTISNYMTAANPPANEVPPQVNSELDRMAKLQSANRAGIVRDTYYNLQVDQIARELRYKYSGYKDYIDQRIQDMTGIKPASAVIKSLRQDVADTMPQEDKRVETVRQELIKEGIDIAAMEAKRGGPIPRPEMESLLASSYRVKVLTANTIAMHNAENGIAAKDKKVFMANTTEALGQDMDAFIKQGLTSKGMDHAKIYELAQKFQANPNLLTGEMQTELQNSIGELRMQYQARIAQRLNDRSSGTSLIDAGKLELKDVEDLTKLQMMRFDAFYQPLLDKNYGAFTANVRKHEAVLADGKQRMLNDQHAKAFTIMKENYGPQVASQILTMQGGPTVASLSDAANQTAREMTLANVMNRKDLSIASADRRLRQMSDDNPSINPGKVTDNITNDLVGMVLNKNTDVIAQANAARALFSSENVGWIGRIQVKGTNGDVDLGATKAKQLELFQKLTTQDVTNQMKNIGTRDPRVLENYVDFALNTGLTVNKTAINDLKSGFIDRVRYAKITFNPQSGEFEASANNPTGQAAYNAAPASPTQRLGDMQTATMLAQELNVVNRQLMPIIKLQTNDMAAGIRSLYSRAGLNIDALSPVSNGDKIGGRAPRGLGADANLQDRIDLARSDNPSSLSAGNNQYDGTSTYSWPKDKFDGMRQQILETYQLFKSQPTPELAQELDGLISQMNEMFAQETAKIPAASIQEVMATARAKQKK